LELADEVLQALCYTREPIAVVLSPNTRGIADRLELVGSGLLAEVDVRLDVCLEGSGGLRTDDKQVAGGNIWRRV
jgi:hypothetical protein